MNHAPLNSKNPLAPKTSSGGESRKNTPKDGLRGLDFEAQEAELAPKHSKPSRPKDVSGKEKSSLEDMAGDEDQSLQFAKEMEALYDKNPNYAVKLIAYKLAKHYDSKVVRATWLTRCPPAAVQLALHRLYPDDTDGSAILSGLEHAVQANDSISVTFHALQDPEAAYRRFWTRIHNPKTRAQWLNMVPNNIGERIIKQVVKEGDDELMPLLSGNLAFTPLSRLRELAAVNPRFFVRSILRPMKQQNAIIGWLKDQALKDILEQGAGGTWGNFVAETPQLAVIDGVKKGVDAKEKRMERKHKKAGGKGPAPKMSARAIVDDIFDAFVHNRGINLSYYTNALDQDRIILSGGTQHDKDMRPAQLNASIADKARQPGSPATQCHNLLAVFRHLVETYPDLDITYSTEHIANILLTKPVASLGTHGLLTDFGGNVFKEDGGLTGEVLFSGNDEGTQSHTWSVINGRAYDPVMGTKGSAVKGAVKNEFTWREQGKLAVGAGGWYLIKDPSLQAPSNTHGFGSGYRRTKDPVKYGFTL